jgi:AcrR family transcriptional regulator
VAKKEIKEIVKQDVKAQILQAAEEEFLSVGYDGARTTNIAKRAGVTHAMLHYYFQSKMSLFERVFQQKAGTFFGSFVDIMEKPLPFIEKVPLFIDAHWQILQANPDIPMFIIGAARKNPDLLKNSILQDLETNPFRKFFKLFEKDMRQAVRQQIIKPMAPIELLLMIFSLNIFPVFAQPVLLAAGVMSEKHYRKMMKQRSRHVTEMVMSFIIETKNHPCHSH